MKMKDVLQKATTAHVRTDPFPHVVVEDALPEEHIERLIAELPTPEVLSKGKDLGSNRHFVREWEDETIPTIWKEFMELHLRQEFYDRVMELVGKHIESMHPTLVSEGKSPVTYKTGLRGIDTYDEHDVLLDAQLFVTTPVVGKPDSYRIGHVDDPTKLYNGLLYLRLPQDDSKGANLEMLQWRGEKKRFHNKLRKLIDGKYVEAVYTIPYRANMFVLIPNSLQSVHRVQVREKTPHPRYYMNVLGELNTKLFDLDPLWESSFERLKRNLGI